MSKNNYLTPTYARRSASEPIPKYRIPKEMMPPETAYQMVRDEMNLDTRPPLNLATFTSTYMELQANQIIMDNLGKNLIELAEYPQSREVQDRVINMLANLLEAPGADASGKYSGFMGTPTIGSSEAAMLALIAHRQKWKNRWCAKHDHLEHQVPKPIIILGGDSHTCMEKYILYFDVEARWIPMKPGKFTIDRNDVEPLLKLDEIRERTMAIICVAGSTYTGGMDDIESIDRMLEENGWDIPIHVDGATGGFVCSFSSRCGQSWNFRLPHVKSINVSNHKFGFVYPGLGSVLFREGDYVPKELLFNISYLGGTPFQDYTLNFSRGSGMLWAQYFNLLRLGMRGYTDVMHRIMETTDRLVNNMVTISDDKGDPVFTVLSASTKNNEGYKLVFPIIVLQVMGKYQAVLAEQIQNELKRIGGWFVPAYQLMTTPVEYPTTAAQKLPYHVVRIMVKENFSDDMADIIYETTKKIVDDFYKQDVSPIEYSEIGNMFRLTC